MYFGSQYYRHPFPYPSDWKRDISRMKELGFNVIKLWAVWNTIEKIPDEFDFSDLDKLVEISEKNGLKVIINTIPEGAPYWTEKTYSDSFYKTSVGYALNYSGAANIPTAGWPGLCLDNDDAKELIDRFIFKTSEHFAASDAVIAIDVWNEPHLEPMFDYSGELLCYCDGSIKTFRNWLRKKYSTIEVLNNTWFRCYTDWEQVTPPPRFGTYADMIDWRQFWLYNLAEWLRLRVNAARRGAPNKLIQSHTAFSAYMGANNCGGLGNELGDEFLLAKEVDVFGLSTFPLWLMGEEHVFGHLINIEIIAEASGDKPFYQSELQGGSGKAGLLGGLVPTDEDIRLWNWSVIAAGGKGVVYWQYSPEPAGMESPGFGLIDSVGGDTPRLLSASNCANQFNKEYLTCSKRVLSINGIYISRISDLITYSAKEEEKYNASFKGIYRLLYDKGIPVRFVHNDTLRKAIGEGLKILYMPMTLALSNEEKALLAEFVRKGGELIIEACTGMYGENGEMDMKFSFLKNMMGMENVTIDALNNRSETCNLNQGSDFSCAYYRQLFSKCSDDAVVIAKFKDDEPAAIQRSIGEGKMTWIGSFVGAEYNKSRDKNTCEFISSLFNRCGYDEISEIESNGLLTRLLINDGDCFVVAVNHRGEDKELRLTFKDGKKIKAIIPAKDGQIIHTD